MNMNVESINNEFTAMVSSELFHHRACCCWRPVMKDLHAVRSLVIMMHSGIDKPVQSFTSSDQRRLCLPRDLIPLTRPCNISVERFSAPKYFNLRRWIVVRKRWLGDSSSKIDWFVLRSVQLILIILRYAVISKASSLFLSAAFKVHDSLP